MPEAPLDFIKSAPVRIGDTIYAQNEKNKLFTFDLNTKKWEVCDGMDLGNLYFGSSDGRFLPKYIGAKYVSSSFSEKNRDTEVGGDQSESVSSEVDN